MLTVPFFKFTDIYFLLFLLVQDKNKTKQYRKIYKSHSMASKQKYNDLKRIIIFSQVLSFSYFTIQTLS